MPVGNVLVGDTRGDIEHDDTALAVDVVAITETAELLLTGRVPDVEGDLTEVLPRVSAWMDAQVAAAVANEGIRQYLGPTYRGEAQRVNLDTEGGHVLLLELTSQVALDKGGLQVAGNVSHPARRDGRVKPRGRRPRLRPLVRHRDEASSLPGGREGSPKQGNEGRLLFSPYRYHHRRQGPA